MEGEWSGGDACKLECGDGTSLGMSVRSYACTYSQLVILEMVKDSSNYADKVKVG